MIVYRICRKEEIEQIFLNYSFDNIGHKYINSNKNTHVYINDKLYMHFFLNKRDVLYINHKLKYFICTYNIPDDILNQFKGIGMYLDMVNFRNMINVEEYAIPSEFIKFEYLESIDELKSFIDFDDYIYDFSLDSFTENIYTKHEISLKREKV